MPIVMIYIKEKSSQKKHECNVVVLRLPEYFKDYRCEHRSIPKRDTTKNRNGQHQNKIFANGPHLKHYQKDRSPDRALCSYFLLNSQSKKPLSQSHAIVGVVSHDIKLHTHYS